MSGSDVDLSSTGDAGVVRLRLRAFSGISSFGAEDSLNSLDMEAAELDMAGALGNGCPNACVVTLGGLCFVIGCGLNGLRCRLRCITAI